MPDQSEEIQRETGWQRIKNGISSRFARRSERTLSSLPATQEPAPESSPPRETSVDTELMAEEIKRLAQTEARIADMLDKLPEGDLDIGVNLHKGDPRFVHGVRMDQLEDRNEIVGRWRDGKLDNPNTMVFEYAADLEVAKPGIPNMPIKTDRLSRVQFEVDIHQPNGISEKLGVSDRYELHLPVHMDEETTPHVEQFLARLQRDNTQHLLGQFPQTTYIFDTEGRGAKLLTVPGNTPDSGRLYQDHSQKDENNPGYKILKANITPDDIEVAGITLQAIERFLQSKMPESTPQT